MEIGLAILLFVCMTALLYVVLSLKITRQVDLQIKEFYKTRIHADMQEFYREMEGYAALFENRIQRFRVLVERNETILREAESAPPAAEPEEFVSEPEPVAAAERRGRDKKQKGKVIQKGRASAKAKPVPVKPVAVKKAAETPRIQVAPPKKAAVPRFELREVEIPAHITAAAPARSAPMEREAYSDTDSAIAEELMKDLFQKDEMELTARKLPETAKPAPEVERPESPGMAKFFSRLGKAIEPVLFGEKSVTAAEDAPRAQATAAKTAAAFSAERGASAQKAGPSLTTDFSEVLRRAEQIKAEKKAERERAEVEARAEFYAGGDSLQVNETRARVAIAAENTAARVQPVAAQPQYHEAEPVQRAPEPPRRNTLAVKELDRHTVNFLIDSLVKDNGYRRQALRALTENNIPLDEIARLSKIDIGELELMRQLGRF